MQLTTTTNVVAMVVLIFGNSNDEENRRLEANILIEDYISQFHSNDRVILLGDLNDVITEPAFSNVFTSFSKRARTLHVR